MNHYSEYKERNKLERKIFKYDDSDLKTILVKNKSRIKDFALLSSSDFDKKMKNISHETISNLLINNMDTDKINAELDKIDKYDKRYC